MTIGRTNSGSGGGALPLSKPLIHITAPLGSNIEISLGGVIVKSIPSSKAIPNIDGLTADYYYSTSATGTYTVTAKFGIIEKSKSVIVSSTAQYDVYIRILVLYYNGDEYTTATGGITSTKGVDNTGYSIGTMTKNADNIKLSAGSSSAIAAITVNKIDLTPYKTFKANILNKTGGADGILRISTGYDSSATSYSNFSASGLRTHDITSLTASYYVSLRALAASGSSCGFSFNAMWLEG